jgi:hypothetical protein
MTSIPWTLRAQLDWDGGEGADNFGPIQETVKSGLQVDHVRVVVI